MNETARIIRPVIKKRAQISSAIEPTTVHPIGVNRTTKPEIPLKAVSINPKMRNVLRSEKAGRGSPTTAINHPLAIF